MAEQLLKELIDAGIHFGHRASRWNPKMKPYIFGKRNLIHIINVKETLRGILLGKRFVSRTVSEGKDVLFVGTKRQARKAVQEYADDVEMHWVADRWLGGTLTNFREIRKRVGRLEELEKIEAEGMLDRYSKKEGSSLRREMRKIRRNLQGIRRMQRLPGVLVVIDQRKELIAVREANKMSIPVICLLDTDCDPDMVDIPIPGNDDAMRAIELVVRELTDAIRAGKGEREKRTEEDEADQPRRRSRRPTTARAQGEPAEAKPAEAPAGAQTPGPGAQAAPARPEPPQPAPAGPPAAEPAQS